MLTFDLVESLAPKEATAHLLIIRPLGVRSTCHLPVRQNVMTIRIDFGSYNVPGSITFVVMTTAYAHFLAEVTVGILESLCARWRTALNSIRERN